MKKTVLFLMVACVSLVGCGGKKDSPKNLPQCDDEVVVQKLKEAIVKDFQADCSKEEPEYCHAEKGVFEEFRHEKPEKGEDFEAFCMVHFSINKNEGGWWVSYKTKYENQEAVVTDIDALAY